MPIIPVPKCDGCGRQSKFLQQVSSGAWFCLDCYASGSPRNR